MFITAETKFEVLSTDADTGFRAKVFSASLVPDKRVYLHVPAY